MTPELRDFATRYTAAWCSRNPARVADFFSPGGSLANNGGAPAVGRVAITESLATFAAIGSGSFILAIRHIGKGS